MKIARAAPLLAALGGLLDQMLAAIDLNRAEKRLHYQCSAMASATEP